MTQENLDSHIRELFKDRWCGEHVLSSLDNMKKQLIKTLTDQINGYWSGSTAYHLAVEGGFLIDAKSTNGLRKELTPLGVEFIESYYARAEQ